MENSATIDVHVSVEFGVKINEVAYNLQKAVKNAVEAYAGIDNVTVNVFVDGIEQDKSAEKKAEK